MSRISLMLTLALSFAGSASAQKDSASHKPSKPPATKTVWPDEGPRTWAPRPTVSAITANDLRTRL